MDPYAQTVSEFGRRLGLSALAPGEAGRVELAFENGSVLQMEQAGDSVLVTTAWPKPPHAERAAMTALALCHWRENHPWPVNAGAKGDDWLTFTARLPLAGFDVPSLDALVEYLEKLRAKVETAG